MTTTKAACLFDGCTNTSKTRGLCRGHYQSAMRAIRRKETTTVELMEMGLLGPSGRGQYDRKSPIMEAVRARRAANAKPLTMTAAAPLPSAITAPRTTPPPIRDTIEDEATAALVRLGSKTMDARRAVRDSRARMSETATVAEVVAAALREKPKPQ